MSPDFGSAAKLLAPMNDIDVLNKIIDAFGGSPRPDHFTNYRHCCECAEHDELLRSRDIDTLTVEDVGNPGWDPICFVIEEGFTYFIPALCRLALESVKSPSGWYPPQLLFHLNYQGKENKHLLAASAAQRDAVVQLLIHIEDTRDELVREYGVKEELGLTIGLWANSSLQGRRP